MRGSDSGRGLPERPGRVGLLGILILLSGCGPVGNVATDIGGVPSPPLPIVATIEAERAFETEEALKRHLARKGAPWDGRIHAIRVYSSEARLTTDLTREPQDPRAAEELCETALQVRSVDQVLVRDLAGNTLWVCGPGYSQSPRQ